MATTRKSPSLSPTKSVLPLIMAEGRLGLKTIPCNRSGAGLGGGGGVMAAVLVTSLCWASAAGALVAAEEAFDARVAVAPVRGEGGEADWAAGPGWVARAGAVAAVAGETEASRGAPTGDATRAVRALTSVGPVE